MVQIFPPSEYNTLLHDPNWMNEITKQYFWFCKKEEAERNSGFPKENLLPIRLPLQTKLSQ